MLISSSLLEMLNLPVLSLSPCRPADEWNEWVNEWAAPDLSDVARSPRLVGAVLLLREGLFGWPLVCLTNEGTNG